MGRRTFVPAGVALAIAAMLGGCGPSIDVPDISVPNGKGDSATFQIGSFSTSVTQSGHINSVVDGVPQLTFSGDLGCKGHIFDASYSDDIDMTFRYSSRDAYLLIGNNDLNYLAGPPKKRAGALVWSSNVDGRYIAVTVHCPLPKKAPPLGPPS
jgi:hypothetical protein